MPHRQASAERDTLHELTQALGCDANVPSQMLITNCEYNERPAFLKKRNFLFWTLLGLGASFRNELESKLHETEYTIEKHVQSLDLLFK